ncbi:unnamed protein product [Oppiella nova]|uniref:Fatty acid desaturase domain-containing protein n=1 Tax=Oppiella nova TaxID=334625 RepID=A0A7R9LK25_9ACAR|nr:unnamed protein product [Oppiella nova]CAG2164427.1 unnamed protein product [Oppiella nova]
MAPVGRSAESVPHYEDTAEVVPKSDDQNNANNEYKLQIVWRNVLLMGSLHIGALYGAYIMLTDAKYQTVIAWFLMYMSSGLGITAGAHRLWSHRSYRANFAMRSLLTVFNTMALQNSIYDWCRDHRVHHKFSETHADPHNANRGFFFAHVGWLLCRKHPDVTTKGRIVDLSDLMDDPLVRFQHKNYRFLILIFCVILPTLIPYLLWSETFTWLINSAAHLYGNRPYDTTINPSLILLTFKHLVRGITIITTPFPASELDWKYNWNFTTLFIDFFAKIGWAYDRKKVSYDMVSARVKRTGDKTLNVSKRLNDNFITHCTKHT